MSIQLQKAGDRFELILRDKPRGSRCIVEGCGRTKPKRGNICNRCMMSRWRANNPERAAFNHLKESAKRRRIAFRLTLEEFSAWGHKNGYFDGRGRTAHCLHVDRIRQDGAYEIGNIQTLTCRENSVKERMRQLNQAAGVDDDCPF